MFIRGIGSQVPQVYWAADNDGTGGGEPEEQLGGEGLEPGADLEATKTTEEPAAPVAKPRDRQHERIQRLTARLREAETERDAALAAKTPAPGAGGETTLTQADVERLAAERAPQLAEQARYNERCNEVVALGRDLFGAEDFNARVDALKALPDPSDERSIAAYATLIRTCVETGEGAKLLYELGKDPDRAEEIMAMPQVKMTLTLAKLMEQAGTKEPSKAPKPATPIGGKGPSSTEINPDDPEMSDKLDTATWIKRREAQIESRRKAA
jgi:hypothetical protein